MRLSLPLGVTQDGQPVAFDLIVDAAHVAVQGQTRSGKSQLAYNLLGRLAALPHVRVVGIDPSGLLLAPFAQAGEPLIALGQADAERSLNVLRAVKTETDERIERMAPTRIDKLDHFTTDTPLWVLVLEEYPGILEAAQDEDTATGRKPGERTEPQIRRLMRQLVAQSAKAGVRVFLMAQRAEASILDGASRSNFGTRISLRVDNADSVRMLHPSADPALCQRVEMFAPGVALIDSPGHPRVIARGPITTYADYYQRVVTARREAARAQAARADPAGAGAARTAAPVFADQLKGPRP
jgi:S-DNA-T family DNA segregation ATPase FtsK/SpoIIIE